MFKNMLSKILFFAYALIVFTNFSNNVEMNNQQNQKLQDPNYVSISKEALPNPNEITYRALDSQDNPYLQTRQTRSFTGRRTAGNLEQVPSAGAPSAKPHPSDPTIHNAKDITDSVIQKVSSNPVVEINKNEIIITHKAGLFGGSNGVASNVPLESAKDATLEFKIKFSPGYDFKKGGKIPGLAGGNTPAGRENVNGKGFTSRFMWKSKGKFIAYLYDMDKNDGDAGRNIKSGFKFETGVWYTIKQRIKLNTGQNNDGILQVWVNEEPVIDRNDLAFMMESPNNNIDSIAFSSFLGGSDATWSPDRDSIVVFKDFRYTIN
jgi:hypothetical protein